MRKPLIYLLLILGIIFLFLYQTLGMFMIFIGLFLVILAVANRKAEVLDNWSILIKDAQGQKDKVISITKESITNSKAPSIDMKEEKVGPGLAKTMLGETRDFLIITDRENIRLSNFKAFINAKDYGDNLFVSWYLTYKPDVWQALLLLFPGVRQALKLNDLSIFDQADLRAYMTNAHHCLLESVEKLMLGSDQDPSKIDRKSRGFLGIS